MKNNLREVNTCFDCEFSILDFDGYQYCNLDKSVFKDWYKSPEGDIWRKEHYVRDYCVCDDYEECR